ncbi:unnamed protein product [Cylicostephanus goldi]|uniref:Uncharacterized protein n=1 Tax=Cylicostephanus goldi TaxID=71465 RepID=A0A3P7R8V7_CYLGO|nr:unnamed protein product [Cylicostephanus goldi]
MLMDEEDDTPIKIRQQPTKDLDEKLRMDAAKASVLSASSPPPPKRASPDRLAELIEEPDEPSKTVLRRIIRDEDLPDSIGPDSPFRHHPKYQLKFPKISLVIENHILEKFSRLPKESVEREL